MFDKTPSHYDYPCRGAMITEKSGKIKWNRFNEKYISFVYIRATKGSSFVDKQFENNKSGAERSGFAYGFIHDIDFSCDGKRQAEAFIKAVGGPAGKLMPVIDLRRNLFERIFYGTGDAARKHAAECIRYLSELSDCNVMLLVDKDAFRTFNDLIKDHPLFVYDIGDESYCDCWTLWAYSENGVSSGLRDASVHYTVLTALKGVTLDELLMLLFVKK